MVDGVNFNPFSGKVFSTDEINKIDTNKDGIVSSEELAENMSWLSEQHAADEEGEVAIEDNKSETTSTTNKTTTAETTETATTPAETNEAETSAPAAQLDENGVKIYDAANVKDTASTPEEIKQYLTSIQDEFIETYMQNNPGMSDAAKSSLVTFVKTTGNEFINKVAQQKTASFDTKALAAELISTLDEAITTRAAEAADAQETLDGIKSNETSFEDVAEYADKADDDYVTGSEFNEMKDQTVSYIMSAMMNGEVDADFMNNFDKDYANNKNYQTALKAVEELKTETDPARIQELLTEAENALGNFLGTQNADGTSKLNSAINTKKEADIAKAEAEKIAEQKETLSSVVDQLVETYSNTKTRSGFFSRTPSADDVQQYEAKLNNIMDAFLEQYDGDGSNIKNAFNSYVNQVMRESDTVMAELNEITATDSADKYQELKDAVGKTGTYVSDAEEEQIIAKTTEFVINQLGQGISDISLLEQISPDYASNEKYVEAKNLIDGIKTSATPKEDLEKAKQLLTEMFTEIGGNKIADGVNNKKMPAITFSDVDYEQFTSSIPGYDNNGSWETGRYRNTSSAKNAIQDLAKQQLTALKPQLMAMLKEQMGADYDEAKINSMLDDAIYQTVNDFSESGFGTKRSGLLRKRGTVNIKQIVDAFMTKFQEISAGEAGQTDKSQNPVSVEEVMKDTSLADAYQDKSGKIYSTNNLSEAKLEAKTQLNIIANELKVKLKQELGSEYDSSLINSLVEQAIFNVVDSIQTDPLRNTGLLSRIKIYRVTTNDLANKFFDEFNTLYANSNAGKTEEVKKEEEQK